MPKLVNYLAVCLIYFLIVYLVAVRRRGNNIVQWSLVVVVNALSVYSFQSVFLYARTLPFIAVKTERAQKIIVILVLILLNMLIVFLANLLFSSKKPKTKDDNFQIDVEDIPDLDTNANGKETSVEARLEGMGLFSPENAVTLSQEVDISQGDAPTMLSQKEREDFVQGSQENEEKVFDTIQTLIQDGKIDEAKKYLRMIAFFGTTPDIMEKAKALLIELQQ